MSKSIISSNNDHLSQLARTQNDLIIAQLQNEIIKVEMDKLRKEKMVLEGAYEIVRGSLEEIRKDDRERIIAVPKNNTAQAQSRIIPPPSTSSPLPYFDLLTKYNALIQSHESLLQARRSDRVSWEALKGRLEGKIRKLGSRRSTCGKREKIEEDVKMEREGEVGFVEEKKEVTKVEGTRDSQVVVTTSTTSTKQPPPIPLTKPASPLAPTSRHNTPTKSKPPNNHVLSNLTPSKQPIFTDVVEKQGRETQTLPASDHLEFESLHLLQSLNMSEEEGEKEEGEEDKDNTMLGLEQRGEAIRSSPRHDEKSVDRSRILVEESQDKSIPRRRDRSTSRSKSSFSKPKLTTSNPLPTRIATNHLTHDDQPRTPFAISRPTSHKIAVSDPPRTSIPSHIATSSTQKCTSETKQSVRWLGRGVNGVTSNTPSSIKRPYVRKDSFEDDQPFLLRTRNDELDTPTNKKARTNDTSPRKASLATSSNVDKIMHGLQGEEKIKQLKELARKKGSERSKVYAPYKGRGRYSDSKPVESKVASSSRNMYEIDPIKNNGFDYPYHEVVRKKECRKHLRGEDCEECKNWYQYTSDLPNLNRAPPFRQPITGEMPLENDGERDVQAHKNEVSRHRAMHARNPTPPGYWNLGFPSTPQVAEENAEADRMHEEKQERIRREAERGEGRYRVRQ